MMPLPVESSARNGRGEVATKYVGGASAIVALAAKNPLKLVVSRERGACARVHAATFGGGLLAGDEVSIDVKVGARSALALGTSAPGKVYRSGDGRASQQVVRAEVEEGGLFALVPAPMTCFEGARYHQLVDISLAEGASLLLTDTLTSGRSARGERWAFDHYGALANVRLDGKLVMREALRIEGDSVSTRFGAFEAISTIVLAGPRLADAMAVVREAIAKRPARRDEVVRIGASALSWGMVVRAAGVAVEPLEQELRALLAPALDVVAGGDAWHGPW